MSRRTPLVGLLAASSISVAGTRISSIALPWFTLQQTGSATLTGLVLLFEMAPYVLAKALGGPLVDRYSPRVVSVLSDVVSGLLTTLVPVLYLTGELDLPERIGPLLAIVAAIGLVRGPGDGARNALIPEVADASGVSIERVTGLDGTADRVSGLAAAGIGGFLIAGVGAAQALLVDAASFFVCALLVALTAPRRTKVVPAEGERASYRQDFAEGARFLRKEPLLRSVTIMVAATNLLDAGISSVLMPVWALENGYDTRHIGIILTAFGITATAGSLVATAMAGRFSRRWAYLVGFTLGGAPRFLVLAFGAPLWLIVAVYCIGGFGVGFINPVLGAIFFERTPRSLVGRVGSLADSLCWAGIPLGGVLAGAAVTAVGLGPALVVGGLLYLVATTVPGVQPAWREMDDRRLAGDPPRAESSGEPDGKPDPTVADDLERIG